MFQGRSFFQLFVEAASGQRSKSSRKYRSGWTPFWLALSISEYIPQELSAPSGLLLNSQFFRPRTKGRMAFSQALLSGVKWELSRNETSLSHWFNDIPYRYA